MGATEALGVAEDKWAQGHRVTAPGGGGSGREPVIPRHPRALRLLHRGYGRAGLHAHAAQLPVLLAQCLQPKHLPDLQGLQEPEGPEGHPGPEEAQVRWSWPSSWFGDSKEKETEAWAPKDPFKGWGQSGYRLQLLTDKQASDKPPASMKTCLCIF